MKTKPRAIGTAAETAVVRYLVVNGFPQAERRSLKGILDEGDVTGTPGICWEVKGGNAARDAIMATRSSGQIAEWLVETETERRNAKADVGLLVVQTPGTTDPGRWWVVLRTADLDVVRGHAQAPPAVDAEVRLRLADVVLMLRAAGYGAALDDQDVA